MLRNATFESTCLKLGHFSLRTGVGRFRSGLSKWVWPLLLPVSVSQNQPSTMLSSNALPTDLLMNYTASLFWTMRTNGCPTLAPRSSAPKQWSEELVQTTNTC